MSDTESRLLALELQYDRIEKKLDKIEKKNLKILTI